MRTRRRSDAWLAMEAILDAQRFATVRSLAGFGDSPCGSDGSAPGEEALAQVLAECERMADERARRNRESVARHRRCNITCNITEKCNITKEKGREREGRKENIPPTPPIREKREEKGKGKETLHIAPFGRESYTPKGDTVGSIYNNIINNNNNNAQARTREAEGDPMLRGPAMETFVPSGRMAPQLGDVLKWAADAATKPGGRPVEEEFVREWYFVMETANPPWTDVRGRDVTHDWRRSLWYAWKSEKRKMADGAPGGSAQNQPEGVVYMQEGYDVSWMRGEGA